MTNSPAASRAPDRPAGLRVRAIFVAGFMGSGKSTVGRAIAARLGWSFVDLDDEIERLAGQSIPRIFDKSGEDGFRQCEHDALREQADLAVSGTPLVLALGGGTYAFRRNRQLIRSVGPAIWLDAAPEALWERVRHEAHRPLARDRDAFLQLHASRMDSYSKADCRVDAAGEPAEVLSGILKLGWLQRLLADA